MNLFFPFLASFVLTGGCSDLSLSYRHLCQPREELVQEKQGWHKLGLPQKADGKLMALVSRKNEERKSASPAVVQLAAKTWLLNTPLWVLPLQCPTGSFSGSPDTGNQTHPISADLECYTKERERIGKGALLPRSHPAVGVGGSSFSRQTAWEAACPPHSCLLLYRSALTAV